jgi:hypothetical protein
MPNTAVYANGYSLDPENHVCLESIRLKRSVMLAKPQSPPVEFGPQSAFGTGV